MQALLHARRISWYDERHGKPDFKGVLMGTKAPEKLEVSVDELPMYLRAHHSVYVEAGDATYYLTDVNDRYWRAQDTTTFNEKGHYVDCSELVPTLGEFLDLPFLDGRTIIEAFDDLVFFASEKNE